MANQSLWSYCASKYVDQLLAKKRANAEKRFRNQKFKSHQEWLAAFKKLLFSIITPKPG